MAYVPVMSWGNPPSVTYDASYKAPKKEPTLVVPSLWWECAGMYTVYVLVCGLAYLLVAA